MVRRFGPLPPPIHRTDFSAMGVTKVTDIGRHDRQAPVAWKPTRVEAKVNKVSKIIKHYYSTQKRG